jgi:hypothetical protein
MPKLTVDGTEIRVSAVEAVAEAGEGVRDMLEAAE